MDRKETLSITVSLSACLLLGGCAAAPNVTATPAAVPVAAPVTPTPPVQPGPGARAATVFTMTNSANGNSVLAFARAADGSLSLAGSYPTGGRGTGGGLGNQAALAFSTDRKLLYVVNAGSDDFTVFQIGSAGLTLASRTPAGGARPISIAEHNGVAYVLDLNSSSGADGVDSISGFRIDGAGQAVAIPNSTRPLSTRSTQAAQVALAPDGSVILVTERGTAIIDAYPLDSSGVPAAQPVLNRSVGAIPFGFQFLDASHVLISEEGTNATSSYAVSPTGALTPISRSVPALQSAVCWLAISPDRRFAFTGNTTGSSVSGYAVRSDASVALLLPGGLSATTDGGALDLTFSSDGRYLYAVLTNGTLETFLVDGNGGLSKVQSVPALGSINGVISL